MITASYKASFSITFDRFICRKNNLSFIITGKPSFVVEHLLICVSRFLAATVWIPNLNGDSHF